MINNKVVKISAIVIGSILVSSLIFFLFINNGNEGSDETESGKKEKEVAPKSILSSNSSKLPIPYITSVESWPPIVVESVDKYNCAQRKSEGDIKYFTTQKIVRSKPYCIVSSEEEKVDKIYKTYTYSSPSISGTKTTTFTLIYLNGEDCNKENEKGIVVCKEYQNKFNADATVDGLFNPK